MHLTVADERGARRGAQHEAAIGVDAQVVLRHVEAGEVPGGREASGDAAGAQVERRAVFGGAPRRRDEDRPVDLDRAEQHVEHREHVHAEVHERAAAADAGVELPHVALLGLVRLDAGDERVRVEPLRRPEPALAQVRRDRGEMREQAGEVAGAEVAIGVLAQRVGERGAVVVGRRDGLLDEHVDAGGEQLAGERHVARRRCADDRRVGADRRATPRRDP